MSQRRRVLTAAFAFAILAAAGHGAARAQAGVELSGTWVLNTGESDDVQESFRRWLQARGVGGGGRGGGGTPGTGAGDNSGSFDVAGGGGGARGAGAGLLGMMQRFSQGAERLTIVQGDPEVTITNATGAANMVFADGRVVERVDDNGGKTKVKTRWKKSRLIIDIDFPTRPNPAGGMITPGFVMAYSLDKSGRLQLASTVSLGAAVPPFTVERVYDREPASE